MNFAGSTGVIHPAVLWDDQDGATLFDPVSRGNWPPSPRALPPSAFGCKTPRIPPHPPGRGPHRVSGSLSRPPAPMSMPMWPMSPTSKGRSASSRWTPPATRPGSGTPRPGAGESKAGSRVFAAGESEPRAERRGGAAFPRRHRRHPLPGPRPGAPLLLRKGPALLIGGRCAARGEGNLIGPSPLATADMRQAISSLKNLLPYRIEAALCYHGGLATAGVQARIRQLAGSGAEGRPRTPTENRVRRR